MRCVLLLLLLSNAAFAATEKTAIFATVGDEIITRREFQAYLHAGMRQRFFHGRVSEQQRDHVRAELARELIDRVLLLQEARRRGITPDQARIAEAMAHAESRFSNSAAWQGKRDVLLSGLRKNFEQNSLIEQLRVQVEKVPAPSVDDVQRYYRGHPDKFTTPERLRASLILLAVDPWAPSLAWQAAEDEAQRLIRQLQSGDADFAGLAKLHSADASGARGGDLGFVHKGMLAGEAQQVLDRMSPGQLSEPVRLLKGVAVLRLDERVDAELNPFDKVRERASGLLIRERQVRAWEGLLEALHKETAVLIHDVVLQDAAGDE